MSIIGEKRSFTTGDGDIYYITDPVTEDVKNADWLYSKIYTKSLIDGISTGSEMTDILTKRGIIGPEYDKRAEELTENLGNKIDELRSAKDNDEKYNKAIQLAECRDELFRWNQRFSTPMAHTCEQLADDARLEHLTSSMITDESGKKIWASYEDYTNEKNQNLSRQARIEVMLYLQGVSSDFMNETPEALAIKEIEADRIAEFEKQEKELTDTESDIEKSLDIVSEDNDSDSENIDIVKVQHKENETVESVDAKTKKGKKSNKNLNE